jgi:hypothetical protein
MHSTPHKYNRNPSQHRIAQILAHASPRLRFFHKGVACVKDRFDEANDHPTSIGDFLDERNLGNDVGRGGTWDTELVGIWEVGVGTGKDAVVVHDNKLFVGDLRECRNVDT